MSPLASISPQIFLLLFFLASFICFIDGGECCNDRIWKPAMPIRQQQYTMWLYSQTNQILIQIMVYLLLLLNLQHLCMSSSCTFYLYVTCSGLHFVHLFCHWFPTHSCDVLTCWLDVHHPCHMPCTSSGLPQSGSGFDFRISRMRHPAVAW